MSAAPRVLLLIPTTSYRTEDFMLAARAVDVQVTVASEETSSVTALSPADLLTLDFSRPETMARQVVEFAGQFPLVGVIAVDDRTTLAAAIICRELGLPANPPEAVRSARDKLAMREALARSGVPQPAFQWYADGSDPAVIAREQSYPCVLKPLLRSGSQGVIRADDAWAFRAAWERITALLNRPEVSEDSSEGESSRRILSEEYIPGEEVAVEGMLRDGELQVLAIFDKPDPLEGPYFAETLYVTPSGLDPDTQDRVALETRDACRALGLQHGPVHAELRVNETGVYFIEIAARSIGGLCSRTLRFGVGSSLEELIIRGALGEDVTALRREATATGVLMLPVPETGVLVRIDGLEEARAVPGITEVTITAHEGREVEALPEGALYLGFVFARGEHPAAVEASLRAAGALLSPRIRREHGSNEP